MISEDLRDEIDEEQHDRELSLPESDLVAESLAFEQPISMTEN